MSDTRVLRWRTQDYNTRRHLHVSKRYTHPLRPLGQTNLICCFSSAPASTSNTPLQLSLLPFASDTPPINAINNHVMSRETSLMASAHGHLNNEVMNNNRPPAPKFRKWLMRNNKSSLSGLIYSLCECIMSIIRWLVVQEVCSRFEFARHLARPPPFYMRMQTRRLPMNIPLLLCYTVNVLYSQPIRLRLGFGAG